MSKSTTTLVRVAKIAEEFELGDVLIRLMMACNDFSLANESLGRWRNPQTKKEEVRAQGAARYFLRLQVSHICEALDIVDEIERSTVLRAALESTDERTKASFEKLKKFKSSPIYRTIKLIRNKVGFHYDSDWAKKALQRIAADHPDLQSSITMGEEALDWYFEPGDLVEDSIVVRQIFKIQREADVRTETDKILTELQRVAETFGDFAGYFVKHHCK